MLVGWAGNNGSTLTAAFEANRCNLKWRTKNGIQSANWFGSLTQASTILLGSDINGRDVYAPLKNFVPFVNPDDIGRIQSSLLHRNFSKILFYLSEYIDIHPF